MPPQLTTDRNLHAVFLKTIDDRQRAKRRRLDERAINFRRRRVKRLADEQAGKPLVNQNGAVAIVPIQREQTGFARLQFRAAFVQAHVRQAFLPPRLDVIHKPVENIADRGLPGFQSEISRQHAAVHDAAKSRNIGKFLGVRRNRDVASARADDFDERARRNAANRPRRDAHQTRRRPREFPPSNPFSSPIPRSSPPTA